MLRQSYRTVIDVQSVNDAGIGIPCETEHQLCNNVFYIAQRKWDKLVVTFTHLSTSV